MLLDLNVKIIDPDAKFWVVHAGKGKRRAAEFQEHSSLLLDMPGLRLSARALRDDALLDQHILMSEAIAKYHNSPADFDQAPARRASAYQKAADAEPRLRYSRLAIHRFFEEIQAGDYVLVPGTTQYDPFFVGKTSDAGNPRAGITLQRFPDDPLPSRRVAWEATTATKRDLSDGLARQFEKTHVVTALNIADFGPELFVNLFGSYVYGANSGVQIDCPGFRGKNPLETVSTQELIAFFVAAFELVDTNQAQALRDLSYEDIIRRYYNEDHILSLNQEFHSPGHYRVISRRTALALLLISGVGLATQGLLDAGAVENLEITNSKGELPRRTDEELRGMIRGLVDHMSPAAKAKLNERGVEAKEEVGTKSSASVEAKAEPEQNFVAVEQHE